MSANQKIVGLIEGRGEGCVSGRWMGYLTSVFAKQGVLWCKGVALNLKEL